MSDLAKILILIGLIFAGAGLLIALFGKLGGSFGRLPGDIYIKKENFVFYFPLGVCVLMSLVLTFLFSIFGKK